MRERWLDILILGFYLGTLVVIFGMLRSLEGRNCRQIEAVKTQIRDENRFDLEATRRVLRDIGIDPESPAGQRLLDAGRVNSARVLQRFRALPCP